MLWEYHVCAIYDERPEEIECILDEKGEKGWELVNVVASTGEQLHVPHTVLLYYFKRPLRLPSVYIDPDAL